MLNPPLSHLSDDLLVYIVEHIGKTYPYTKKSLCNLSLADRAFTQPCQKYIFRDLKLADKMGIVSRKLETLKTILDDKPFFANHVRLVELSNSCSWLFSDHTFISILQLLSNSPVPPHEIRFSRTHGTGIRSIFNPLLVVRSLTQSFFSQTLSVLHLKECTGVPLSLFLICPRLRQVSLEHCSAETSYDEFPDNLCSGREPPSLEVLSHRNSNVVEQMITPPPRFNTPMVLWSNLRVLTLSQGKGEMACLQPILDGACGTLEELYLTNGGAWWCPQLSLAGRVNLHNVPTLQVFAVYTKVVQQYSYGAGRPLVPVLHDINIVLGTIPRSNKVTNLCFDFTIVGSHSLEQDWVGIFDEVIRISDGKTLELELKMGIYEIDLPGQDEMFTQMTEKATSVLSAYPNISTRFCNPTLWGGLHPFPGGQGRSSFGT
ncbi:hypothetical protein M413DRAFT_445854 [Hebeloma cylindrosporum]|uniref:F-box domain-containing protein n=1 Tax=Hebeloma cylindrosporum TaxID=76867 RepID=A0A0C3CAA8_HEBCY|nr:hypothetical protein M413DRAFT_445854 [Hebeloma cylindrosporum h7]